MLQGWDVRYHYRYVRHYLSHDLSKNHLDNYTYAFRGSKVEIQYCEELRDREVACLGSDRQGSNFESCVCRE